MIWIWRNVNINDIEISKKFRKYLESVPSSDEFHRNLLTVTKYLQFKVYEQCSVG